MNSCQDTAVRYTRAGWPVFPCKPNAKEPATRHGVLDAETDPGTVARWWSRHPDANVAIATGAPGPTVLDVDVAHGKPGNKSLNRAVRAGLVPAAAALIRTPSGGSHLYFAGDAQGNGSMPRHGLDLRGKGGYVVAPPSTVGGRPYVVVHRQPSAAHLDFAEIREHLQPQPQRPAWQPREGREPGLGHLAGWVAGLAEGNRNAGHVLGRLQGRRGRGRRGLDRDRAGRRQYRPGPARGRQDDCQRPAERAPKSSRARGGLSDGADRD